MMRRRLAPGRHLPLLLVLCVLFVLYPLLVEAGRVRLLRFAFVAVLAAAVYGLVDRRTLTFWGLVLALPASIAQVVLYVAPGRSVLIAATALGLAFLALVIAALLGSVMRSGAVTSDRIAGAISVYLLLGLAWALAYGLVGVLDSSAFGGVEPAAQGAPSEAEYGFLYYSFATLSTLGYGDVVPLSPVARSLAWTEAVTGQLFLAVLVARLVGLQIAGPARDRG